MGENMCRRLFAFLSIIICLALLLNVMVFGEASENKKNVNDWCLDIINAPDNIIAGDYSVRVAVIDSGVQMDNMYMKHDKIDSGYNYVFNNTVTNDLIGHGTQAASIIIGGTSQNRRLTGIGSNSTIIPLVWITKYSSGVLKSGGVKALCSAIMDAVDRYGCKIINVSSGICTDEPELRKAAAYAEKKGVILIASVGNSNQYAQNKIYYPAAYKTVVGVGSVNKDKLVSKFSQRNTSVMVTAPGEKVYSVSSDTSGDFVQVSGTSFSAAYVSAFAALLLSKSPQLSPEQFRQILKDSSLDMGEKGYDTDYGYGIIDVSRGLSLCEKAR